MTVYPTPSERSVFVVGAGRLGTTLGLLLQQAGYELKGASTRTAASAAKAEAILGCSVTAGFSADTGAGVVLISVPDDAVESAAHELVDKGAISKESFVVHTAGSLGIAPLEVAASAGATTLAVHVLQSIPDPVNGVERIPGSWFAVTCADSVWPWAKSFVGDLSGAPFRVSELQRPRHHLAAVIASNFLVALAALVEETSEPLEAYLPLMRGTLQNIAEMGPAGALTGPVARGDTGTLERHLKVLADAGQSDIAYRALSDAALELAERSGKIDGAAADRIRKVIEP